MNNSFATIQFKKKVNPGLRNPLLVKHQTNNEESLVSNVKNFFQNSVFFLIWVYLNNMNFLVFINMEA